MYSESLFLLLTLVSFAAGRKGRWWLAGAAGLLAAATRSAGLLLVVPLAWMWLEQRRGRPFVLPGGPRQLVPPPTPPARVLSLAWLLLVPAGLGLFMAYTQLRFGNALLFTLAQRHWHRHLRPPTTAIVDGTRAFLHSIQTIVTRPDVFLQVGRLPWHDQWLTFGNLTAFLGLVFGVVALAVCWRVLPTVYTLFEEGWSGLWNKRSHEEVAAH